MVGEQDTPATLSPSCPPFSAPLLINALLPKVYSRAFLGPCRAPDEDLKRHESRKIRESLDERVLTH